MHAHITCRPLVWTCWIVLLVVLVTGLPVRATTVLLPSGISAEIISADELVQNWQVEIGGRSFLNHPALGSLEILTGPTDPRLLRDEVEAFVPYDQTSVVQALADMHGIQPRLEVVIFLLPAPPARQLGSFATGNVIVLSPGFGPLPATSMAYTVTHEMGHVLTWAYLDKLSARWQSYLELRGLTPCINATELAHADQVREILAEDIRFLFGGSLATASGTIENHDLLTPNLVPGLRSLLASFFQGKPILAVDRYPSRAVPNPCNPVTTIRLQLPAGIPESGRAQLLIFDVRGHLVRRLTAVERVGDLVRVTWNGLNETGGATASGQYCYRLQYGDISSQGNVVLIR